MCVDKGKEIKWLDASPEEGNLAKPSFGVIPRGDKSERVLHALPQSVWSTKSPHPKKVHNNSLVLPVIKFTFTTRRLSAIRDLDSESQILDPLSESEQTSRVSTSTSILISGADCLQCWRPDLSRPVC